MAATEIPGYRYGDPSLPPSSLSLDELHRLQQALLFSEEDARALRRAREILAPQVDAILDVWYGFVGSHDFLLAYFATPAGPDGEYLSRVRARFGQWILDTCRADYDETWLAYQDEIARRHYQGKNQTDGVEGAPPIIHFRYVNALIYPIFATIRPFLEQGESDPAEVERMHQAWLKAVLLQVTLWSRPYLREGAF
ncbi:MAG: protoglobin domain-containing protein [Sphaerobacter sp.]|nr:protoglobin domain-containing protein [Sphaerobacter sp.]